MPINILLAHIALYIERNLIDSCFYHDLSDIVNNHIFNCVRQMIRYEKYEWNQDYFMFYTKVSSWYILYAFNTYLLKICSFGCPHHKIICASSLNKQRPPTMKAIMKRFAEVPTLNDSKNYDEPAYLLLSVNNS